MTLSFWHRQTRRPDLHADVAIVGGGIIGVSTAFWMRRLRPDLRVVLLEAGTLAGGASGRNAGFVLPGTAQDYRTDVDRYGAAAARRLWRFTVENRELLASELDGSVFALTPSGGLVVAATPEEDERLRASVAPLRALGAPVAYVPAAETAPRIRARGFGGSLYLPTVATVDPVALVRHVAQGGGADVLEHHRVFDLDAVPAGVRLETALRAVHAEVVVLALNAYLPQLVPEARHWVRPVRAQMLATPPMPAWLPQPVYSHRGYFYLRQAPDGSVLVGGARHLHEAEEVGYADATTPGVQADLEAYLHGFFPHMRHASIAHRWSGTMGFSPDGRPAIGEVPGIPGAVWAAGFTGHGMGYGFRFGRLLAEHALGRPGPEGLDLFTADRFLAVERSGAGR